MDPRYIYDTRPLSILILKSCSKCGQYQILNRDTFRCWAGIHIDPLCFFLWKYWSLWILSIKASRVQPCQYAKILDMRREIFFLNRSQKLSMSRKRVYFFPIIQFTVIVTFRKIVFFRHIVGICRKVVVKCRKIVAMCRKIVVMCRK